MNRHGYVAVSLNDRRCNTCQGHPDAEQHRSLVDAIVADAAQPTIADRIGPDVRARMEAVIARQGARPISPVIDGLVAPEHVLTREQYKAMMLKQPSSKAESMAADVVNAMAKLAPLFGVKRKGWDETSKWDRALWIATLREALT